ncbi:hypothetical protein [Streptomyces sp. enrichment culture]|uniref:hypothetical protein n=1 Tax=Streptomyces sp. enrichment culture TaxID=1795815 RepID=UPI003F566AEA
MKQGKEVENPESRFFAVLMAAAKLPGVRIHREAYLRSALARHCSEEEIRRAIEETPAAAGITVELLDKVANESIRYETVKVSALSAAAGIPGILALPATVPADTAQYVGHMLRIAQKLAYLYSWPELFSDEGGDVDDATKGMLTLFFVAKYLGVKMTTQSFAKGVSKAIPVIGAVVSGGLTLSTYLPMAKRLKKHLAGLPLADPSHRASEGDVVDGEVVEEHETFAPADAELRDADTTAVKLEKPRD